MHIRDAEPGDLQSIRERSAKTYDKLQPPMDSEEALVVVDSLGKARVLISAERVTELYMVMDHEWETPAMRWAAVEMIHREMLTRLKAKGYKVGYSFFADGVPNGYIRRLVLLGWDRVVDRCVRFVAG